MTETRSLEELEEAVRAGDETVSPEDIHQARLRETFAGLRQEAAERAERLRLEQEHRDAVTKLKQDIRQYPDDVGKLASLAAAAVKSLDDLCNALTRRNRWLSTVANRARELGFDEPGVAAVAGPGDLRLSQGIGPQSVEIVGERRLQPVSVASVIERMAYEVSERHDAGSSHARYPADLPAVEKIVAGAEARS